MSSKKRVIQDGRGASPQPKKAPKRSAPPKRKVRDHDGGGPAPRPRSPGAGSSPRPGGATGPRSRKPAMPAMPARPPARNVRPKAAAKPQPRIRASHAVVPDTAGPRGPRGPHAGGVRSGRPLKPLPVEGRDLKPKTLGGGMRKAPLGVPKRAIAARPPRRTVPPAPAPGPSNAARELALALAAAAIEKKALGIEILDVTGKVDYADFLVVMTGRGGRHVHAIATGIEEEMRKRKSVPLSVEGLAGATWVLIDFGDVVVHVFQEEARALYDIEGLWIDAGRIPVPDADKVEGPASHDGGHPLMPGG